MPNIKYSFIQEYRTTFMFFAIVGILIIIYCVAINMLSSHPLLEPQPVRVAEDIVTLQMKPEVLIDALESNGSEWCEVDRRSFNNPTIDISTDDIEQATFNRVFLTDSLAPIMAREYSNLFEYTEGNGKKVFSLKDTDHDHVTVPVWLVKTLVDMEVLELPDHELQTHTLFHQ